MLSPNEITNDYKTLPEVTQRSSMRSVSHMQMQKPRPMLLLLVSFCLLSYFQSVSSKNLSESDLKQAGLPPRGWNSYDAFSWIVSEEEFLQNAQIVSQRLRPHGYEFVVVDFLWYRKNVPGANSNSLGFDVIDKWGRMVPDPGRWPSSKGGNGFSEVAKKVHSLGLKFGIHIMRGISTQAMNANTPILDTTTGAAYQESGRVWYAKDIAIQERRCGWMNNGFMSVNAKLGAGRAFLRSLHEQYAAWGVDLVKHDCVFGSEDFDFNEISYVSEVLSQLNRPIVYSLSPGVGVTPSLAKDVSGLVNMYRITGDDWDTWQDVAAHFDISRDLATANLIGAKGLKGNSWPDLDMLPFGWLTDADAKEGPHRYSKLNLEEKRTQMTLWALAKSPLMYGGDVRKIDPATYEIITNPTVLEINYFSSNNMEFHYVDSGGIRSWIATGRKGEVYLAFFNLNEQKTQIYAKTSDLAKVFPDRRIDSCQGKEVWSGKNVATTQGTTFMDLEVHGCALLILYCD